MHNNEKMKQIKLNGISKIYFNMTIMLIFVLIFKKQHFSTDVDKSGTFLAQTRNPFVYFWDQFYSEQSTKLSVLFIVPFSLLMVCLELSFEKKI